MLRVNLVMDSLASLAPLIIIIIIIYCIYCYIYFIRLIADAVGQPCNGLARVPRTRDGAADRRAARPQAVRVDMP